MIIIEKKVTILTQAKISSHTFFISKMTKLIEEQPHRDHSGNLKMSLTVRFLLVSSQTVPGPFSAKPLEHIFYTGYR